MANTNIMIKDLDHFDFIESQIAREVAGGATCTEDVRTGIVAWLQGSGVINPEQGTTLLSVPLADFCGDFGEFLEVQLGVQVFDTLIDIEFFRMFQST